MKKSDSKGMSLIKKVVFAVAFVVIAAEVGLGGLIFFMTRVGIEGGVKESQLQDARTVMDKVDRLMYERWLDMVMMGEDDVFESILDSPDEEISQKAKKEFLELPEVLDSWGLVRLVNVEGRVLLSSSENEEGESLMDVSAQSNDVWRSLQSSGDEVAYSDVVWSEELDTPVVIFVVGVRGESQDRPLEGGVVGYFLWREVFDVLVEEDFGELRLLSDEGVELASESVEEWDEVLEESYVETDVWREVIAKGEASVVTENIDEKGSIEMTSFVRQKGYKDYEGSGWIMMVQTPYSFVTDAAFQAASRTGGALLAVGILGGGFVVLVVNWSIIRPISKLTVASEKLAGGELDYRVEVMSRDEVGRLGQAFNDMASKLQLSTEGLEKTVKERTVELENAQKGLEKTVRERTAELEKAKVGLEKQVVVRTGELDKKVEQMEAFNKAAVGREKKMVELKGMIVALKNDRKKVSGIKKEEV